MTTTITAARRRWKTTVAGMVIKILPRTRLLDLAIDVTLLQPELRCLTRPRMTVGDIQKICWNSKTSLGAGGGRWHFAA
jgi:hypothetical protein